MDAPMKNDHPIPVPPVPEKKPEPASPELLANEIVRANEQLKQFMNDDKMNEKLEAVAQEAKLQKAVQDAHKSKVKGKVKKALKQSAKTVAKAMAKSEVAPPATRVAEPAPPME